MKEKLTPKQASDLITAAFQTISSNDINFVGTFLILDGTETGAHQCSAIHGRQNDLTEALATGLINVVKDKDTGEVWKGALAIASIRGNFPLSPSASVMARSGGIIASLLESLRDDRPEGKPKAKNPVKKIKADGNVLEFPKK